MLVQDFLRKQSLEKLEEYYGIKNTKHEDGRVILNYSQIDSAKHKTNPIVRECRGLVLDSKNNWELVARSFTRFFNLGETDEHNQFNWSSSYTYDKLDGSLILIYYWGGMWHLNTRGSFGEGEVNSSGMKWRELFTLALPNWKKLDKNFTYCFELCSRYNKVVTDYPTPSAVLLSAFQREDELSHDDCEELSDRLDLIMPQVYSFGSVDQVQRILKQAEEYDPTFEGYVLRDSNNLRIKVKSSSYIMLHRQFSNKNINSSFLYSTVLKNEISEILNYFPELKSNIEKAKKDIESVVDQINVLYNDSIDIKSRKEFAKKVISFKYSWILFQCRDKNMFPEEVIKQNLDKFINYLCKYGV